MRCRSGDARAGRVRSATDGGRAANGEVGPDATKGVISPDGGGSGEAAGTAAEVEAKLEPLPFDATAVRSYGLVVAAVVREGRTPCSRFADLLIAATAHAYGLDLYTRNGDDFTGLEQLVRGIAI